MVIMAAVTTGTATQELIVLTMTQYTKRQATVHSIAQNTIKPMQMEGAINAHQYL